MAVWEGTSPALRPETFLGELSRLRYQFLGALVFAVLLPVLFRWGFSVDGWLRSSQVNTIVATSLAILAALIVLKQLATLPGVRSTYYLAPVLLLSFLVTLSILFFARIDHNRYLFPASLIITGIWLFFAQSMANRYRPPRFAIVPGGEVDRLVQLKRVVWIRLDEPMLPPHRISGVAADLRQDLTPEWERFITMSALSGVRVFHFQQLHESLVGRVEIKRLSENTLGSINPDAAYLKLKQLADWLFALVAIVVLAPLLVAIGVAIKLESSGPALFWQRRVGFRGKPFDMVKFRTMADMDAEVTTTATEAAMTKRDDPRITRIGRYLRRTRLDELPQIFNILRGEMSWIGPRPEAAPLSQWYAKELPFYRYRHIVRPGISGWAQVNQGHVTAVDEVLEKLHYDFYYIKNFSPWLDIVILVRTIRIVLTGFGSR